MPNESLNEDEEESQEVKEDTRFNSDLNQRILERLHMTPKER